MIPVLRIVLCVGLLTIVDASLAQVRAATDSRIQKALTLEQHDKNAEAEAVWRAVLKADPNSAEACGHLGLLEARQGHYKEAVPFYRKALALNPAVPGLGLNLGLALFKSNQLKEAVQEFTLLRDKASTPQEVQRLNILIGMSHYGLGEYAAASRFLKQAAAVDTQNLQLRLALAHSCLWSKQFQCVLDTYHEMLALNAESAEVDMLAGEAEDEMKEYDGAIAQFRAAVKADPKEPGVHFGLGYILWTQRRYPEAATEFQAELANNPIHAQALVYLGDTEIQLNHPELAPPLLKRAVALDAKLELAHLDLGILDSDAGRNEDALKELTTAVKLAPNDVNVHWRLARLYRTMGKKDEAKAEFDKASTLNEAADDDLFTKIAKANARPGQAPEPAPATPQQ
ncbi:MAG TPA: tetratricopeptide repeat protein [Terracidiphilus sp.]|jgi:tetratricopeptide (TPR) repeat protein